MLGSFISKQIARTNRNLLLTNLLIVAVLAGLFYANAKYMVNFFRGTKPISKEELLKLRSVDDRFATFVKVNGDEAAATGIRDVEETRDQYSNELKSEETKAEFKYLFFGQHAEKVLVVKAKPGIPDDVTSYAGELVPMPEDVRQAVIVPIQQKYPAHADSFLPVMLDTVDYRSNGYWAVGLGVPVLLLCLWNLKKWLARSHDETAHPIYKQLERYGVPDMVIQEFEGAVASGAQKFGDVSLAGKWIMQPSAFGFRFMSLDEMIWAYKKVTKNSVNFIPTGKTYNALAYGRSGAALTMSGKEKMVDSFLQALAQSAPWAIFGYKAEIQALWDKDRASMAAAVDERKKQYSSKSAGAGSQS